MGSTKIEQPSPPQAPSTSDAVNAWVENMPKIFAEQQRQAPLEAQQQIELAQRYAQPYGEAMQAAQRAMNPETFALQEQLARQAGQGMESGVPDWMKQEYLSNMNAQLGQNVQSRAGADYTSRGLLQQKQDWQNYYRNLGLSVAGRQPLAQPQTPQTSNYTSGFTPLGVGAQQQQGYGNYAGAYSSMYGANAQVAAQGNPWENALAGGVGMMGGMAGFGFGSKQGWW